MKRLLLTFLPAVLSLSHVASGQSSAAAVSTGARVRLFVVDTLDANSGELKYTRPAGRVVALDGGSLVLQSDTTDGEGTVAGDTVRVPVMHIGTAEAYTGLKRHPIVGAAIGLVTGSFVGFVAGDHAAGRIACAPIGSFCVTGAPTSPDTRARYAAEYGGAAALVGGIIGYVIRTERWSQIDIGRLRLQAGIRP